MHRSFARPQSWLPRIGTPNRWRCVGESFQYRSWWMWRSVGFFNPEVRFEAPWVSEVIHGLKKLGGWFGGKCKGRLVDHWKFVGPLPYILQQQHQGRRQHQHQHQHTKTRKGPQGYGFWPWFWSTKLFHRSVPPAFHSRSLQWALREPGDASSARRENDHRRSRSLRRSCLGRRSSWISDLEQLEKPSNRLEHAEKRGNWLVACRSLWFHMIFQVCSLVLGSILWFFFTCLLSEVDLQDLADDLKWPSGRRRNSCRVGNWA